MPERAISNWIETDKTIPPDTHIIVSSAYIQKPAPRQDSDNTFTYNLKRHK